MHKTNEKPQESVDGPGHCAKCGSYDEALLGGQCPRCLMSIGLEFTEPGNSSGAGSEGDDPAFPLLASIARYRIIRQIGEGGMGVVYEAEQEHPSRTVALKVIKPGFATPELLRRFEDEAQALGRLQHPGIAQIFEAGTADTGSGLQPYFAMELIRGTSLTEYADSRHLGPRERLALVAKVAEAAHHAHQRGLIHRDLKPGNILVDESGQPKIVDFGVARVIDSEVQRTVQTDIGRLIGTLAYMSPEQASADPFEVDIRTDVYALGVLLYELLAGRPLFVRKRLDEAIQAIREEDPARLSSVNRTYRGDIETIVAKALEKDKTRRYTSAAELAADIGRYLRDEPIVARPASAGYQLRKFARRHQGLVAGAAAGLSALLLGFGVATWQAALARHAEREALQALDSARLSEAEMRIQRDRAASAEAAAKTQRNLAEEAREHVATARDRAVVRENEIRQDRDRITWQNLSRESVRLSGTREDDDLTALLARQAFLMEQRGPASQSALVENVLQQARRTTWWSHSLPLEYQTGNRFFGFTPDGRLATNGPGGSIALVDLRQPPSPVQFLKGQPGLRFAAFSRNGKWLFTSGNENSDALHSGSLKLWDLAQPNAPPRLLQGREASGGMFSPNGKRLVTSDSRRVLLWDLENPSNDPELLPPQLLPQEEINVIYSSVAFSSDGNRLLTTEISGGLWIWDVRKPGAALLQFHKLPLFFDATYAVFSPVEDLIASVSGEGVRLWEPGNSSRSQTLLDLGNHEVVAFSPDGQWFAVGTGNIVRLWARSRDGHFFSVTNLSSAPLLLQGHKALVTQLAFSPDGRYLVSRADRTRVFELGRVSELSDPGAALDYVGYRSIGAQYVAFSAKGERLFNASGNGALRVRDRPYSNPWILLNRTAGGGTSYNSWENAFSADGSHLARSIDRTTTRIENLLNPESTPLLVTVPKDSRSAANADVICIALSSDGTMLAQAIGAVDRVATILLWDLRTMSARPIPLPASSQIDCPIAYSPDGTHFAAANQKEARVWNLRHLEAPPQVLPLGQARVGALAFSPDGHRLAIGAEETIVWDFRNPQAQLLLLPSARVDALRFSPDGFRLASGGQAGTQIWDLRNPSTPPVVLSRDELSISVAFPPDGIRLAGVSSRGAVSLWPLGRAAADDLCARVWRNLSMEEWRQYVGESIPYERTCPALPPGPGAPTR